MAVVICISASNLQARAHLSCEADFAGGCGPCDDDMAGMHNHKETYWHYDYEHTPGDDGVYDKTWHEHTSACCSRLLNLECEATPVELVLN